MKMWIKAAIIFFGGLVLGTAVGIFVILNLGLEQKMEEPIVLMNGSQTVDNEKKNDVQDAGRDTQSVVQTINGAQYKNNLYDFSLTFPKNWGEVTEETVKKSDLSPYTFAEIRLRAANDEDRFIEVHIVENKYRDNELINDAPWTDLMSNNTYSFYWTGGGDHYGYPGVEDPKYGEILVETQGIMKTFKLF